MQRKCSRSINDIPPEETEIMQQKMFEDVIQENFSEMKKDFNLQNTGAHHILENIWMISIKTYPSKTYL